MSEDFEDQPVVVKEAIPRHIPATIDLRHLPSPAMFLRILGVNYARIKTDDGGDLYMTEFGVPYCQHLQPENWYEEPWFSNHRTRLEGTSAVYRVRTRPVEDHLRKSLEIVVKWSRVGQDVPLDTFTLNRAINAEFNTPFEEFSLLMELRAGRHGVGPRILTQKPLAIYVPSEQMQSWQTGRSKSKIIGKVARHPAVEIDILRSYILLYAWIRGVDTVQAYQGGYLEPTKQKERLAALTHQVNEELDGKGFLVADNKPTHVIVRTDAEGIRKRHGKMVYALIDYELLARTPEHEAAVKARDRSAYLAMQRDRFTPRESSDYPPQLHPMRVLDVPYVYGRTESTNGALYVVGHNPDLFNYFLPERWRTRQVRLSSTNLTYYSTTKDGIHLVWKVSRVGELPPGDFSDPGYRRLLKHGFNAPFEEFALALRLARRGVPTVYPRAIYMTGPHELNVCVLDDRRFERMEKLVAPDGEPVMTMVHDYITIWGYFRGLEDADAPADAHYWTPIDAEQARHLDLIDDAALADILERQRITLAENGLEDLTPRGDHVLLSYIPPNTLKRDAAGRIEQRQCNYEMVRPTDVEERY